MAGVNGNYGRASVTPQSTVELLSLLGKSARSSWTRYLGMMVGFAIMAFIINMALIQYNVLIKGVFNQYITPTFLVLDPVIQLLRFDLAINYQNVFPTAALWLLIGFILVIIREQGLSGLRKIPKAFVQSGKDILKTKGTGIIILVILAVISFLAGINLNNPILIFAIVITILYALSARQNGVLVMALRLLWSDIRNISEEKRQSDTNHLIPLGYPLSILFGIWIGLLTSFLFLVSNLF